ncbi:MAG: PilN domain-containing protein [Tepidisphaeraceae bacterium]
MREPEFVPSWYPLLLRRRRFVMAQAWAAGLLLVALSLWAYVGQRQVRLASAGLDDVNQQLDRTGGDLHRLQEIEAIKGELEQQDQIVQHLGVHVPAGRMLAEIEKQMPARMALTDFRLTTEESAAPQSPEDKARGLTPRISRKLRVSLVGFSPTEDELAQFLTNLVGVAYFGEVELVKAEDHADGGHLMRKFEVRFALNLDTSADAPAVAAAPGGEATLASGGQ